MKDVVTPQTLNSNQISKKVIADTSLKAEQQATGKKDTSHLLQLKEKNLFSRFLEANCDCV